MPKIEKIQVVAAVSRVEEAIESVPATVSVIERQDAFRDVAGNLRDLVRYEPGVTIEGSPTRFGLGNFNIRGLEGNRVQMTVDGIRLPESYRVGSFSNASRNALGIGLLRQVEIVRGPSSAIHGSDALAGVVAFTTLDPSSYLAGGKSLGGEAFAAYADADRSSGAGGAVAFAAGETQLLVGAERSSGHEVANMGTVGGTGATRTEPNPQDTRTDAQLVKWVIPAGIGLALRPHGGALRARRLHRRAVAQPAVPEDGEPHGRGPPAAHPLQRRGRGLRGRALLPRLPHRLLPDFAGPAGHRGSCAPARRPCAFRLPAT